MGVTLYRKVGARNQVEFNMGMPNTQVPFMVTDEVNSVSGIKKIYDETIEELHRFSQIVPSGTIDDHETDKAEAALVEFESFLLSRASKLPLQNEQDVNALMDIWAKAAEIENEAERPSDKIAMNIFRYLIR